MRRGISVKLSVVPVLFFAALCAPGFGYVVLWDTSHGVADVSNGGGYQPSGHYSDLVDLLELPANGFTVNTTTEGFEDNLTDVDIAVVCITSAFSSPYSDDEANILAGFVNAGGGLLILGTHPSLGTGNTNIQPVATEFGITLAASGAAVEVSYTPDALEHPVFAGFTGIDSIYMPAAGKVEVDEDGFALVQESATEPFFIAGKNLGTGRVIALGDFNMFSQEGNFFGQYNNPEFALNTFEWLAVPEPATILLMATGFALLRRRR